MAYVKFVVWFVACLVTFSFAVVGQLLAVMIAAEWWNTKTSPDTVTAVITAGVFFSLSALFAIAPTLVAAGAIANTWLSYWPPVRNRIRAILGLPKIYDYV